MKNEVINLSLAESEMVAGCWCDCFRIDIGFSLPMKNYNPSSINDEDGCREVCCKELAGYFKQCFGLEKSDIAYAVYADMEPIKKVGYCVKGSLKKTAFLVGASENLLL